MAQQTALHFILTIAWVMLTDSFSFHNFTVGFLVGGLVLWFFQKTRGERIYLRRIYAGIKLVVLLIWEQIKASFQVARIVLSRELTIRPGIKTTPLYGLTTDAEVTAVANMLTITPGSLSLDFDKFGDHIILYTHVIDLDEPNWESEALIRQARHFEKLVLDVTKP